jgi:hypothetical protein
MRKFERCINCGDEREIAAKGLCYTCYRQQAREKDRWPVDRHSGAINKERQKLFQAHAALMVALGKMGVGKADIEDVIRIVRPYLTPISEQLRFAGMATGQPFPSTPAPPDLEDEPEEEEKSVPVNSEHDAVLFTVHRPEDSELTED